MMGNVLRKFDGCCFEGRVRRGILVLVMRHHMLFVCCLLLWIFHLMISFQVL